MFDSSVRIAPSLLAADLTRIHEAISSVESAGATCLHIDVMDGHFVPDLSFGPSLISDIRAATKLTLDVHLMITNPELAAERYVDSGSDVVIFHHETCVHAHRLVEFLQTRGVAVGVAIIPSTPVASIVELLGLVDRVLVMTVNPGFGGQELIQSCIEKVRVLAQIRNDRRLSFLIETDGGMNERTLRLAIEAGADSIVMGTAVFSADDPGVLLRRLAEACQPKAKPPLCI